MSVRRMFVTLSAFLFVASTGLMAFAPLASPSAVSAAPADGASAPRAPADREINRKPATVHPDLRAQLQEADRVVAVITAWTYEELDDIWALDIGLQGQQLIELPMILTTSLTSAQLDALEASPAVRSVYPNREYEYTMEDSTWITGARYVWGPSAQDGLDITGEDVHIAVIDTGADGRHEDMDNLVEFCETILNAAAIENPLLPITLTFCSPNVVGSGNAGPAGVTGDPRLDSQDDEGHGSHVSGTVAGTGDASGGMDNPHSTIGMAPEAKLHVYSVNVAIAVLTQLAAYDDMIHKKSEGIYNIIATSNSFGGGAGSDYDPDDPENIAIELAYDEGILSVYAAGNDGPEHNTLSSACVNPFVVCVGATTKPDSVAMFSSRGRPSEPADTNRNGIIHQPGTCETLTDPCDPETGDPNPNYDGGDTGDVAPDNHDRALAMAFADEGVPLGLYRPTLLAPGVAINSIAAASEAAATCIEDGPVAENCYAQLQGTSMSTPHVSGAVALITQAFREAHGVDPTPFQLIEILERSSDKIPGYEAEEQGAGRLNVRRAVQFAAMDPADLPPVIWGTPSPIYAIDPLEANLASQENTIAGCTLPLAFTSGVGFGQHVITVPEDAERLRITVAWPDHPQANLYLFLWRPSPPDVALDEPSGVDPDTSLDPPGPRRAHADQESTGLLEITEAIPFEQRWMDVRSPEAGDWILRVYHRASGAALPCGEGTEDPDVAGVGFNYDVRVETPTVQVQPVVAIEEPNEGDAIDERFEPVFGSALYPNPWEGVTNWEIPEANLPDETEDTRTVLYLHGNPHSVAEPEGEPAEIDCTGVGPLDVEECGGPFLLPSADLHDGQSAVWGPIPNPDDVTGPIDEEERGPFNPNWLWCVGSDPDGPCGEAGVDSGRPGPTTVSGPMTVEWWASTNPACEEVPVFVIGWVIRLYADGNLEFESERIVETPLICNVPDQLSATVTLPPITAERYFVLHIDVAPLDTDQEASFIYYDSTEPCAPLTTGGDEEGSLDILPQSAPGSVDTPQLPTPGVPGGPVAPEPTLGPVPTLEVPDLTGHSDVGHATYASYTQPAGDAQNVFQEEELPADACDSLVRMPVGEVGPTTAAQNVRVTDVHDALRIAWDPLPEATEYAVYRSTNPLFDVEDPLESPIAVVSADDDCPMSPNVPSWAAGATASRPGLCYTDDAVTPLTTYYYRVVALFGEGDQQTQGDVSSLAYGARTIFDRQVRVQVDRLFGPQYWDFAILDLADGTEWSYLWDTMGIGSPHSISARSYNQGIGSDEATLGVEVEPPASEPPPAPETEEPPASTAPPAGQASPTPTPTPRARFIPDTAFEWAIGTPAGIMTSVSLLILLGSAAVLAAPHARAWLKSRR